jgi:predicted short-subunit dehydrogenase-like oxidoreductase (DUF2520 family)
MQPSRDSSTSSRDSSTRPRLGVIGAGRLGTALAAALGQAGYPTEGPARRGEVPHGCHALLLCVPDSEIGAAARAAAGAAPFVGHTSGATPLSAMTPPPPSAMTAAPLSPQTAAGGGLFGLHPLQSFTGEESLQAFAGAGCAIAGTNPQALELARRIAADLGMTAFEIDDDGRAAYHAAASIASNFLVTLEAAAERIAAGAGLEPSEARALLAPLVLSTARNWAELGPDRALTGPVARGDEATVAAQRAAVEEAAPELLALFDELVARTRDLARLRPPTRQEVPA